MKLRLILALALAFAVAACGVKGDLVKPNGQVTKGEKDPSKPPQPIGR